MGAWFYETRYGYHFLYNNAEEFRILATVYQSNQLFIKSADIGPPVRLFDGLFVFVLVDRSPFRSAQTIGGLGCRDI